MISKREFRMLLKKERKKSNLKIIVKESVKKTWVESKLSKRHLLLFELFNDNVHNNA